MLPFESVSKFLLFIHLVSAFCAVAVAIHLLSRLIQGLRGRIGLFRQMRLHARLLALLYAATFLLGAMVYPTFRVRVRPEYFDRALPWATAMFELKEHGATAALLPATAVWLLARSLDFRDSADRGLAGLIGGLVAFVLAVLLFNAGVGWYLCSLRSI
jgi:hypothetical protein